MAEIVVFPTEAVTLADEGPTEEGDRFLLDEGLELLADFRSILDLDVRASLRALVKSLASQAAQAR